MGKKKEPKRIGTLLLENEKALLLMKRRR